MERRHLFEVLLPVDYTFGDVGFDSEVQGLLRVGDQLANGLEVTLAPFQIHSTITSLLSGEMSVKGP